MPAGPRGWLIVGSLVPWLRARNGGKMVPWLIEQAKHGEMTTLSMGSKTWVLLNTPRAVNEILSKRASSTHERPYFPIASGLVSRNRRYFLLPSADLPRWSASHPPAPTREPAISTPLIHIRPPKYEPAYYRPDNPNGKPKSSKLLPRRASKMIPAQLPLPGINHLSAGHRHKTRKINSGARRFPISDIEFLDLHEQPFRRLFPTAGHPRPYPSPVLASEMGGYGAVSLRCHEEVVGWYTSFSFCQKGVIICHGCPRERICQPREYNPNTAIWGSSIFVERSRYRERPTRQHVSLRRTSHVPHHVCSLRRGR